MIWTLSRKWPDREGHIWWLPTIGVRLGVGQTRGAHAGLGSGLDKNVLVGLRVDEEASWSGAPLHSLAMREESRAGQVDVTAEECDADWRLVRHEASQ